jgi:arsenite methyltransferase
MSESHRGAAAPDYGLDAPKVVRNLVLAGVLGLLLFAIAGLGLWSGELVFGPIAGLVLRFPLAGTGLWSGIGCTAMALWMVWEGKLGKIRRRERLLDNISWTGHERVLDVGCGRGLMLVGAAKRLTTGRAVGVDIWQAEDLSGNRPDAVLENARLENVSDRVEIQTADMRQLPFPDGTFDVVVSSEAIHNVYSAEGRARAIGEIARVLKPGGLALIEDIRHQTEYATTFERGGCKILRRIGNRAAALLLAVITMGSLRPGILLAQKTA